MSKIIEFPNKNHAQQQRPDFDGVSKVASWITPVPGGVGKMTITMLLANAVEAAERMPVT